MKRVGLPFVASFVPFGGLAVYLSPFLDKTDRRQGWHDKVALTVVMKEPV